MWPRSFAEAVSGQARMAVERSALNYAGRAYKRECGWDLVAHAGSRRHRERGQPWAYTGSITGFVVLSDRVEDGPYEMINGLRPSLLDTR